MAFPSPIGCMMMYVWSIYLYILVEFYGKLVKKLPVPWIPWRIPQKTPPAPQLNKTASKPPKTSSHQVFASAGKPIRCRLAFIMISRKASGRLGAVGGSRILRGAQKKKTNGKHESRS